MMVGNAVLLNRYRYRQSSKNGEYLADVWQDCGASYVMLIYPKNIAKFNLRFGNTDVREMMMDQDMALF
jgi:hypothetical protein